MKNILKNEGNKLYFSAVKIPSTSKYPRSVIPPHPVVGVVLTV